MGLLLVLLLAGVSAALIFFFGCPFWVLMVLGLLWLAALGATAVFGHRGFGGGGNTDLLFVVAGAAISAALIYPRYVADAPCGRAKAALARLAEAQREYFAQHATFAPSLALLKMGPDNRVSVVLQRGDAQSFAATASHALCTKDGTGELRLFTWDSARGGLQ